MVCPRNTSPSYSSRLSSFGLGRGGQNEGIRKQRSCNITGYIGDVGKDLCTYCSLSWLLLILVASVNVGGCPHRCYGWFLLGGGQLSACSFYSQGPLHIREVKSFLSSASPLFG